MLKPTFSFVLSRSFPSTYQQLCVSGPSLLATSLDGRVEHPVINDGF